MKKTLLLISAALLLSIAGCRQVNEEEIMMAPGKPVQTQLAITAGLGQETRTSLESDGLSTVWGNSEYLKLLETADGTAKAYTSALGTVAEDGRISFMVSLDQSSATSFAYYGLYPAADYLAGSSSPSVVKVNLPASQNPTSGSYGQEADMLVAAAITGLGSQPSTLNMSFSRIVALGKMTLTNIPTTDDITSVSFSATGKTLAGTATLDLGNGVVSEYGSDNGGVEKLSLNYAGGISPEGLVAYFTCWPCNLAAGDEVVVEVNTSNTRYVRTFNLPKAMSFAANRSSRFTVDMSGATEEATGKHYEKISDDAELVDGVYLIVCEESGRAMDGSKGTRLSEVRNNIQVSISDDRILSTQATDAAAFIFNKSEGSFLSTTGHYFGNSSDSNNLSVSTSRLTNTVSINAEGNADIICEGGAYLRYNPASSRRQFRFFQSTTYTSQQPVCMYKLTGSPTSADLTKTVYGAYFSSGIVWVYEKGKSQLSRSWKDGGLTFALINTSEKTAVEMSGIPQDASSGSSFTLTVTRYLSLEKDAEPSSTASYSVSVAKVQEPRLYLTTEAGDMFIVKK